MAIDLLYLKLLKSVFDTLNANHEGHKPHKVACLSYPDLLVSGPLIKDILGDRTLSNLEPAESQDYVRNYHSLPADFGIVYETQSLFEALGCNVDFFDIKKLRGNEKIIDLNEPLPASYRHRYDLVIDTGTLEHCFNIGNAFKCMCELVQRNGWVISMAPLSMTNHGFWNVNPTAYFDAFSQNGFSVHFLRGRTKSGLKIQLYDYIDAASARVRSPPAEAMLICIARRESEQAFKWPVQAKYLSMLSGKDGTA